VFTGLVEEVGEILEIRPVSSGYRIWIRCQKILEDLKLGDSVAVDGACLTVVEIEAGFKADVSPETLKRTTLKDKKLRDKVNLERALRLGDRLGGHLVTGHIDGIGRILKILQLENFYKFEVEVPEPLSRYVVEKGSIAIDGISLTVNRIEGAKIQLMIIPHTLKNTTLKYRKPGDQVNVEVDIIAKIIEKLTLPYLKSSSESSNLSLEFLKQHGFL